MAEDAAGPAGAPSAAARAEATRLGRGGHTARFFAAHREVGWTLLVGCLAWGAFAYQKMPKAKDPALPSRIAVATCVWPGATAEKVEQLVTRRIEARIAENAAVERTESTSRSGISVVRVTLGEEVAERGKELEDIRGRLDGLTDLPQGAGPIQYLKDFGDTAALLLTVASPRASDIEIALRGRALRAAVEAARAGVDGAGPRAAFVLNYPPDINARALRRALEAGAQRLVQGGQGRAARILEGPGFVGVDVQTDLDDAAFLRWSLAYAEGHLHQSELHPDVWRPLIVRDLAALPAQLAAVAGDRYSYRQLDDFTETLQRYLQSVPSVSKVSRAGVLPEAVYLDYSQERLASYGLQSRGLGDALAARNITMPGGVVETASSNITIDPSGELHGEQEIGDVLAGVSGGGAPFYLRDLVEVSRTYLSPPRLLCDSYRRGPGGAFRHGRAITLSVQMRPGEQIGAFGAAVDARLAQARPLLPDDLVLARTSDQPQQVRENVALFMDSLYEAIALVVLVALLGFWEWRSACLLSLSIPITLAMTFGLMALCGIEVQQISIASLILSLGLLVDDPVVAGDAIKRSLDDGWAPAVAAWLGPTKLARAILFATITNIAAYLPLLTLTGDVGRFIYSLPVVLTCSLVASRLVSMSFIPLLGRTLLRPRATPPPSLAQRRTRGVARHYARLVGWAIAHPRRVLVAAVLLLALGALPLRHLKVAFFPTDVSYLSYVDIWLPEDAPLAATRAQAQRASEVIRETLEAWGRAHPDAQGRPQQPLEAVTSFVGGGAPRFYFSVFPEISQLNYAQLVVQLRDKHLTPKVAGVLQEALSRRLSGAQFDVRQLENGKPVGIPAQVRISGESVTQLRALAAQVKAAFAAVPIAERVRDDWGADVFAVKLQVDPTRANLAGVTNYDVGASSATAMNGQVLTTLREGSRQIPVFSRLRAEERAQLGDIQNLYVAASGSAHKVPLKQVSTVGYRLETEKIRRRSSFRCITVACFPVPGALPSEVMRQAADGIAAVAAAAPLGYEVAVGGEQEEQQRGFSQLATVLLLSILAIYLALMLQFGSATKPFMVFAAIPFGVMGALVSLAAMRQAFGFMAFLGIVSLIGVIVSHIIVLFDFIEEQRAHGAPLHEALIDAGIVRLRPVLITVGATVLGLVPLALHGGPLWEPLCYAQIGGLSVATFITLLLVPVMYAATDRGEGGRGAGEGA